MAIAQHGEEIFSVGVDTEKSPYQFFISESYVLLSGAKRCGENEKSPSLNIPMVRSTQEFLDSMSQVQTGVSQHPVIRIGVIGIGNMGQHHTRFLSLLKDVELIGIADLNV